MQRPFSLKVIVQTHTHWHIGPTAVPVPLRWSVEQCDVDCSTVTPPKPVHKHGGGSGGGSTSTAGKKKEFDPSQSLVYQMLQEENERAKRGDVAEPAEEEPNFRRQPQQQQQQPQQQPQWQQQQQQTAAAGRGRQAQPQQGSRLQELLERDRAASQQEEDEHMRYADTRPQPPQQPRQPAPRHPNQARMQPAGASYHQQSAYIKGSPAGSYHQQQQQPVNPSYEDYYQQGSPTRSAYYQNAPHMAGYSSYAHDSVPISDFWSLSGHLYIAIVINACQADNNKYFACDKRCTKRLRDYCTYILQLKCVSKCVYVGVSELSWYLALLLHLLLLLWFDRSD